MTSSTGRWGSGRWLRTESGSAALLAAVTLVALVWANSPLSESYFALWRTDIGFHVGPFGIDMDLHHWINDGVMAVFFFVVGLEVRQEFAHGALRDASRARLALIAGTAGVVLPALIYLLVVGLAGGAGLRGWGAVVGTDTAFLLGALAIVGPRLSAQLRVFLLTLSVVDDFLAVSIIGVVYSDGIRPLPLLGALACLIALWLVGRSRHWRATPYVLIVMVLGSRRSRRGSMPLWRGWSRGCSSPRMRRDATGWSRPGSCSGTSGSRPAPRPLAPWTVDCHGASR